MPRKSHPTLFETPYYAGPDGPVAVQAYSLLAAALRETGRVGIGKVVLHDREDVVMIAPYEKAVVLYRLRSPEEIRNVNDIPQLDGKSIDQAGLKLARSLVDSMTTTLDKIDLSDKYHDALKAVIEAKIAGKEIVTVEVEEKPVMDIMTALKRSIEQAKSQKKPMEKAKGKKRPLPPGKPRLSRERGISWRSPLETHLVFFVNRTQYSWAGQELRVQKPYLHAFHLTPLAPDPLNT